MSFHVPLPKKLEDELDAMKYYKPSSANSTSDPIKSIRGVMDDAVERAMYDEILGPLVNRNSNRPTVSLNNTHKVQSSSSSTDFTTSILSRLKLVEAEAKDVRRQLAQQITYNQKLEQEVIDLRCLVTSPDDMLDEVNELKEHNRHLQHKIREMETFLGDYGLTWVGNSSTDNVGSSGDAVEDEVAAVCEHHMTFADFNRHIQELNAVVYAEPAQVLTDGNSRKARLVQASELVENIKVVFYKNGLMIKRGPFRPCGSATYTSFVEDVLDGYFPYEFKSEYPDGVTFDLKDRRDIQYVEGSDHADQMSAAQFLNRLPKTVIRNGQVVSVRSDLEARLGGEGGAVSGSKGFKISDESSSPVGNADSKNNSSGADKSRAVVLNTPALLASLRTSAADAKESSALPEGDKVVQIQIRWVNHGLSQLLLAHMLESDSVLDLRQQIAAHCNSGLISPRGGPLDSGESKVNDDAKPAPLSRSSSAIRISLANIELRSAYPPRILSDEMTLMEAGLVPNGTVHGKRI